jgi:hypothetical protein
MCHPTTISKGISRRNNFQLLFNYFAKTIGEGKKKTIDAIINKKFQLI